MRVQDRGVAMVYQQFINYPSMTVYNNIASPCVVGQVQERDRQVAVSKAAGLMQLTPMLDASRLSYRGGHATTLCLARALVKDAGLVLWTNRWQTSDYKLRERSCVAEIPKIFEEQVIFCLCEQPNRSSTFWLGAEHGQPFWEGAITQFWPDPCWVTASPLMPPRPRVFS